ncbi:hypothetical protein GCM10020255_071170 [Rhodococcus baikonurensis]
MKFWGRGGNTDLDNLIMLCGTCHRALHDDLFTITALGEQKFEFRYADGGVIDPAPPTEGFADDLLRGDVPDDAIVPAWGGEPPPRSRGQRHPRRLGRVSKHWSSQSESVVNNRTTLAFR